MRKLLVGLLILPLLTVLAPRAHADAVIVGSALADFSGNLTLDIEVDPNAEPTFVKDQLKSNLELNNGATVDKVDVKNGVAHVSGKGATPSATVEATLNNDVANATGVGPSPAGVETRRRAFWLLGGLAGLAAGGGSNNPPQPLAPEPPPPPPPTQAPAPPASTGP